MPPDASQTTNLPQLEAWQFQPDDDTPGLYLQCANAEQREAIMRALGWRPGVSSISNCIFVYTVHGGFTFSEGWSG